MSTARTPQQENASLSDSDDQIISPTDATSLWQAGCLEFKPQPGAGSLRIHKRRVHSSSDEEYEHLPLRPNPTLPSPPSSTGDNDLFATIPAFLRSYDTLLYLGFSEARAAQLWDRWVNWNGTEDQIYRDVDGGDFTFEDLFIGPLRGEVDPGSEDDADWFASMTSWGIDETTQDVIMNPIFKTIRLTNSCLYWIVDTLKMRYRGLGEIQEASRHRDMQRQRLATRGGTSSSKGTSRSGGSSNQGRRSISDHQHGLTPGLTANTVALPSIARNAPGTTSLYRAQDKAFVRDLYDNTGALANTLCMLSHPPSDFSATQQMYYFTPDFAVAQCYARWTKNRVNVLAVVIIRLEIPNSAIKSLVEPEIQRIYWGNPDWKPLIWHSRRHELTPRSLSKYDRATLIIGHIARRQNSVFHSLAHPDDITEEDLLKIDERGYYDASMPMAVQYAFHAREGTYFLQEHARNVKVGPYTGADFTAWVASLAPTSPTPAT